MNALQETKKTMILNHINDIGVGLAACFVAVFHPYISEVIPWIENVNQITQEVIQTIAGILGLFLLVFKCRKAWEELSSNKLDKNG